MTNKSITTVLHSECCGCKACGDVCPKVAISFAKDDEGFYYPIVNENCIDCGLCSKVCPANNDFEASTECQTFVGCLDKNKGRRDSGSSGGLFGLLASRLISDGRSVYGAAFDEHLQLKHQVAESVTELSRLKKSKYLQSDCKGVYSNIKQHIAKGGKVMFVGTPCQCAALKRYLGNVTDNVLLVDFACHGVPSQDLFDRCIAFFENRQQCKVTDYQFRYKTKHYGSPQNFLITYQKDGLTSKKSGKYYEEPFYCGFQKYITLRPSCYACKFARTERVGDITLADFWGIESATRTWDRTDYPSLVILNTEEGRRLFESIKPEIDFFETTKEFAVRENGSLVSPTKLKKERGELFADIKAIPFPEVVNKHLIVNRSWIKDVYYALPFPIRKLMLKITSRI